MMMFHDDHDDKWLWFFVMVCQALSVIFSIIAAVGYYSK